MGKRGLSCEYTTSHAATRIMELWLRCLHSQVQLHWNVRLWHEDALQVLVDLIVHPKEPSHLQAAHYPQPSQSRDK